MEKKQAAIIIAFTIITATTAAIAIPPYINYYSTPNQNITPTSTPTITTPTATPTPTQTPQTSPTPTTTPNSTPTITPTPTQEPLNPNKLYFQATTQPNGIPTEALKLYSDTAGQNPLTYINWGNMYLGQTKKIGTVDPAVYIRNKGTEPIYFRVTITNLPTWVTVTCHTQLNTIGLYNETVNILNSERLIRIDAGKKAPLEFILTVALDAPESRGWIATLTVEGYATAVDPIIPPFMYYD